MKPAIEKIDDQIAAHTYHALNKKYQILQDIDECLEDIELIRQHIEELKEQLVIINLKINFKHN